MTTNDKQHPDAAPVPLPALIKSPEVRLEPRAPLFSFDHEGQQHTMRTVMRDGEPWFVAADVCSVLGYANSRAAVAAHVEADDKGVTNHDTLGGRQRLTIINESGLFALILRSNKPEAKVFQRWVTKNVLPSIRKHGAYAQGAEHLTSEAQANLYAHFRAQTAEALRRHDKATEHDHWVSARRRDARSLAASQKIAQAMGLPLALVSTAAASGVERAVQSLAKGGAV